MKDLPVERKYTGIFGGKTKKSQTEVEHEAEEQRRVKAKPKIIVYGFDKLGYEFPVAPKQTDHAVVFFIPMSDRTTRFEDFDGAIIPQGIFERFEVKTSYYTNDYCQLHVDEPLMLEKEKQVRHLIRKGGWVCFPIEKEIRDRYWSDMRPYDSNDTDLCKRIMNVCDIRRETIEGVSYVEATRDEFRPYIDRFGIAKNQIWEESSPKHCNVIAKAGRKTVGLEFQASIFFLPLHSTDRQQKATETAIELLIEAISDYRLRRPTMVPDWVQQIVFDEESKLGKEISSLEEQLKVARASLEKLQSYKAILALQSDPLKNKTAEILKDYFGLNADPSEQYVEDIKILGEDGSVTHFIEATGTTSGVTRQKVRQADEFRERNSLSSTIPSILIINNEMKVEGIDARLQKTVPDEQIDFAKSLNVLVIRTIDLIFLMKYVEIKSIAERKSELLSYFNGGGGWLRVGPEGVTLISSAKELLPKEEPSQPSQKVAATLPSNGR